MGEPELSEREKRAYHAIVQEMNAYQRSRNPLIMLLSTAPQKRLTHQAALSSASRSALAKTLSNERRVHLNGLA